MKLTQVPIVSAVSCKSDNMSLTARLPELDEKAAFRCGSRVKEFPEGSNLDGPFLA